MGSTEDLRTGSIVIIGIVGAILMFVIIVAVQALFLEAEESEYQTKVMGVTDDKLRGLRAKQLGVLHGYRWVDRKKGLVAIPIEEAMRLIVEGGGSSPDTPRDR